MASGMFFVRPCPTCGRHLEIRVELLGREVQCRHCSAEFTATQQCETPWIDMAVDRVLARAERYMASLDDECDSPIEIFQSSVGDYR
jgi:RNA polymerases M/15 Kd subunit